jgi:hypothetical protein
MAVISRHPIVSQEEIVIPSPGIEIIRPDDDHWKMFDKGAQRVTLNIDDTTVSLINLKTTQHLLGCFQVFRMNVQRRFVNTKQSRWFSAAA